MEINQEKLSDNTFLHEHTSYQVTDPTQFDDGTPLVFAFAAHRPNLEQAIFIQDRVRLGSWNLSAGVRLDHYQVLVNRWALSSRVTLARYFSSHNLIVHFSTIAFFKRRRRKTFALQLFAD